MKIQKSIDIVVTNTDNLNLMSERTLKTVRESLDKNYKKVSVTRINDEDDLNGLIQKKPDLVFSGVKYLNFTKQKRSSKNKIWLSSLLKKYGINHTGSETQALKLAINKVKAKRVLLKKEILTSNFFTAIPGQYNNRSMLPIKFPLFIKPINEGCGKGIDENSVVHNFKEFKEKVFQLCAEENNEVLVEKYLSGREFTVGIIKNLSTNELQAFPIELIAKVNSRGDSFLSEVAKQEDHESVIPIKERRIFKKVAQFAKKSFKALGARDYGRIDLRMDQYNRLYFLEANLVPGIGSGYFSRALEIVEKISHSKMINGLAALAINRAC